MAYSYITAATTTTLGALKPRKVRITVNAALTGTITVKDGSATVAIITNPTVGSSYDYWDFSGVGSIVTNATCDITVNYTGQTGRH